MNVDSLTDTLLASVRASTEAALPPEARARVARIWTSIEPALRAQCRPVLQQVVDRMHSTSSTSGGASPSGGVHVPPGTELIGSVSLDEIFADRARILALYDNMVEIAVSLAEIWVKYYDSFPEFSTTNYGNRGYALISQPYVHGEKGPIEGDPRCREDFTKKLDTMLWRFVVDKTQILSIMSASKREEWQKHLSAHTTPPFTPDAVIPTLTEFGRGTKELAAEAVFEAFRSVSWDHKTNSPIKLGKTSIFASVVEPNYSGWLGFRVRGRVDEIADLYRIFHILEGKPQPADQWTFRNMVEAAAKEQGAAFMQRGQSFGFTPGAWIEIPYMRLKFFQNGNAHVEYTRPDLVDKMNQMIAEKYPRAIPAPDPHKGRNRR